MACPDEARLERLISGAVKPHEAEEFERHLTACETCADAVTGARDDEALLEELQALRGLTDRVSAPTTPDVASFGGYRIVRRLGAGGMGVVYEAEQQRPRRRVALKVMKASSWNPAARDRFRRESELLGRLDHPGIARIFESGTFTTSDGDQPFFAMELVCGRRLDEAAPSLAVRDRVALLADVADAVHHAHQHAIVHRDLKPSNIMVTDDGAVKVLDFGVARALDDETPALTRDTGQPIGTMAYMSPEQVSSNRAAVGTRSDVYALGVIAYEVLTGTHPLPVRGLGHYDAIRAVVESEPRRLGDLDRHLRGDLESIVSTAMEKDADRRYPSAAALADDLRRFLDRAPVMARPRSAWYVARRFAQRNPAIVILSAGIILALVAGIAISFDLLFDAREAERRARSEQEAARLEATDAIAARDWMQELLVMARPGEGGRDKTLKELVLEAARRVDDDLAEHPKVRAAINHTLGRVFLSWKDFDAADAHLRTALRLYREAYGHEHRQVAYVLCTRSTLELKRGNFEEAMQFAQEALGLRSLMTRKKDLIHIGSAAGGVAAALYAKGQPRRALEFATQALAAFRERDGEGGGADTAITLSTMALMHDALGDQEREEACLAEALPMIRRALGPRNVHVAGVLSKMAGAAADRGDLEEAEKLYVEALSIQNEELGPGAVDAAMTEKSLGRVYFDRGERKRGIKTTTRALETIEARLGGDHPRVVQTLNQLGRMLRRDGRLDEAARTFERGISAGEKRIGRRHFLTMLAVHHLGRTRLEQGRSEEALALLLEYEQHQKPAPWLAETLARNRALLGRVLVDLDRATEALPHLERALAPCSATEGPVPPELRAVVETMVDALEQLGRESDAARWRKRLADASGADGHKAGGS